MGVMSPDPVPTIATNTHIEVAGSLRCAFKRNISVTSAEPRVVISASPNSIKEKQARKFSRQIASTLDYCHDHMLYPNSTPGVCFGKFVCCFMDRLASLSDSRKFTMTI